MNIFDEIEKLNDTTTRLFSELYEYRAHFSDEAYAAMQKGILDVFKKEYEVLFRKYRLGVDTTKWELDACIETFVPARPRVFLWFRKRNRAAKLHDQRIDEGAERFFEAFENALEAERAKAAILKEVQSAREALEGSEGDDPQAQAPDPMGILQKILKRVGQMEFLSVLDHRAEPVNTETAAATQEAPAEAPQAAEQAAPPENTESNQAQPGAPQEAPEQEELEETHEEWVDDGEECDDTDDRTE